MRFQVFGGICLSLFATSVFACNCTIGKDQIRCDYYVVKKQDVTHQNTCLKYAKNIEDGVTPEKSSWYFLLGGDIKEAKKTALLAIKRGKTFANEYLGVIYLLEHKNNKAKVAFLKLKKSVKDLNYAKKDIELLGKLYKDLNVEEAKKMLE